MDVDSIDAAYRQLETEGDQTEAALTALATKLQAAVQAGNPDAREWSLDLREIALAIRSEQQQVTTLLQQLHGFVQQVAAPAPQQYAQPGYAQQQYQQPQYQQQGAGGMLGRFMSGGFGRAIVNGAGFGLGDDLINKIL